MINVKHIEAVVKLPDRSGPLDAWVVVAWWHAGWWKVYPDQWSTEEAARKFADQLSAGYTRRLIFHMTDEGAKGMGVSEERKPVE